MTEPDVAREEEHYRDAERAMLLAEDAAKRITSIAAGLEGDRAPDHLVTALNDAAAAIRLTHREMVKTVYWKPPDREGGR